MSVSGYSQIWLQKTVYNNENAFIGNEAAMDSIASTYINYKASLSHIEQLNIQMLLWEKEFEKLNLKVDFLSKDNSRLSMQKTTLQNQLSVKDDLHAVDLLYYKEKAKEKFSNFLFGTALGGLIVAIISMVTR